VPPFSGFWSEDSILAQASAVHPIFGLVAVTTVFVAGTYISRAAFTAFFSWPKSSRPIADDPSGSMRWGMILLALAAVAIGWLLSGRLQHILQFSAGREIGWNWRAAAIVASLAGLCCGALRVFKAGPVPAFGAWPSALESAVYEVAIGPARLVMACANGIEKFEKGLDAGARSVANQVCNLARLGDRMEFRFDEFGQALTQTGARLAWCTEVTERQGFSLTVDRFARLFGLAGESLRALQVGRIYLYTRGLFIWVFAAGAVAFLVWY